jgi:hypothetical protein
MKEALRAQAKACASLGSKMYESLFLELLEDYEMGGRTYALLAGRSNKPIHDAIPLRLAGAIHRVVLRGEDSRLARHYPSVGGKPGEDFPSDFIAYMRDHLDEIELGLDTQVQTNEVGRSVVHLMLSHWVTTLGVHKMDWLEVGASAGLNLNFDRFYACFKQLRMGDPQSTLRFMGEWFANEPLVPRNAAVVVNRKGTDPFPIDVTNKDEELRLLSFVWPDQRERLQRIQAAIDIAKQHKPFIDRESADTWIERQLSRERDRATLVFHSITWQYLGETVQKRFVGALEEAGLRATLDKPLIWARMEPAGPVADVRVTVWNGGTAPLNFRLCEVGYHGQNMNWLGEQIY